MFLRVSFGMRSGFLQIFCIEKAGQFACPAFRIKSLFLFVDFLVSINEFFFNCAFKRFLIIFININI